jgi:hypothetical protein
VQLQHPVPVEIGVDLQEPARPDLVDAAAFQQRVRNQSLDPGQSLQEAQEGR